MRFIKFGVEDNKISKNEFVNLVREKKIRKIVDMGVVIENEMNRKIKIDELYVSKSNRVMVTIVDGRRKNGHRLGEIISDHTISRLYSKIEKELEKA